MPPSPAHRTHGKGTAILVASSAPIAIVGGTGALGTGLARRWARAGRAIVIGSRARERAESAAAALRADLPSATVRGADNRAAAAEAEIVVMTVPFAHHRATLEAIRPALAGRILVDVTAPLVPPKVARVQLPPEGSAAKAAQAFLGEEVRVVSAFQNIAADHLAHGGPVDCDVLVCGNSREARAAVIALVEAAGMRGWHAGAIDNSAAAEALTSVLIFINRHYRIAGAGIRITGTPGSAEGPDAP